MHIILQAMNMHRPYSGLIERLKDAGLRPTRQRLALGRLLFDDPANNVVNAHGSTLSHKGPPLVARPMNRIAH